MEKEELVNELLARLEELKAERSKYEADWTRALELCAPYMYNWSDLDAIPRKPKRFTSEACAYLDTLVSGFIGYSVSPSIKWFSLSLTDDTLLDLYGVKDFLEKCEQTLVAKYIQSDLYQAVRPFIQDAVTIGHGALFIGENLKKGTLKFTHHNPNELFLDVDEFNEVDTVFREFQMTPRQMEARFGLDALGIGAKNAFQDFRSRGEKRTVLFAVYPRKEYDESGRSDRFPYAALYIDKADKHILSESGFHEFPYAIYEYAQYDGRAYGDSLAQQVIEDMKFLEITTETTLKIAQVASNPPLKVSSNLRNISTLPGAINELNRPDDVIDAIRTGDNYPISLDVQKMKNEAVRKRFNVDYFQMLQSLEGKVMTATEVMELQGEKAATLSSLIVSMNNALEAIITRSFNILMRNGELPSPPESLLGTNAAMKVTFVGPLAQAQQKYYSAGTVATAIQQAAPIMQIFPTSGDYIDADTLIKKVMESSGMPQDVIREDDDVEKLRRARLEAQQAAEAQAVQMQQQENLLKNIDKLGKGVESGSPLSALDEQLAGGFGALQ